jgi:hypothetical protein
MMAGRLDHCGLMYQTILLDIMPGMRHDYFVHRGCSIPGSIGAGVLSHHSLIMSIMTGLRHPQG